MDIIESLEVLVKSNIKSLDPAENKKKIECIKSIESKIKLEVFKEEFPSLLCFSILTLLRTLQDHDMNVWSYAEQVLNKIIKTFYHEYSQEILTEIWRAMKGTKVELKDYSYSTISIVHEGRSKRYALQLFSLYTISPVINDREFKKNLTITLADLCLSNDQLLHETLSEEMGSIIKKYLYDSVQEDFKVLIVNLLKNTRSPQPKIKNASIKSLIDICHYGPMEYNFIIKLFNNMMKFLFPNVNEKINIDFIEKNMNLLFKNIKNEDSTNLLGILYFMSRFLKFIHENSLDIEISKYVSFILIFCDYILDTSKEDSVISECLRLIEVILNLYIDILIEIKFNGKLICILDKFLKMLFDKNSNDISKVLVLSNISHLTKHKVEEFIEYIKKHLTNILELRKNYDPLISGNIYNFIGYLIEYFLTSNQVIWEEFDPSEYLHLLLTSVFTEMSSVVSKNIIVCLFNLIPYLFESKFYDFVPYMINYLICLPHDSNRIIKIEIISSLSKLDYRLINLLINSKIENHYSEQYNPQIECQDIQTKVVNFILSFFDDSDQSIRNEACNSLIQILPNLDYKSKYGTSNTSYYNILDLQSSLHYTSIYNNCWKEQIDYIMWSIMQRLSIEDPESNFMKGFYYLLGRMYESGFDIIPAFIPLVLDQISSNSISIDLEAQLNIIKLLSYACSHLNGNLLSYIKPTFNHVILVMNILLIIVKKNDYHRDNIHFEDMYEYFEKFPYYSQLYTRLEEAYNLSLTTFKNNIFDQFCLETIKAMERMIPSLNKMSIYFINRIFLFAENFYRRNPKEIMDLLDEMLFYIHDKSYLSSSYNPNTISLQKERNNRKISMLISDSRIFDSEFLFEIRKDKLLTFIYKEIEDEAFKDNERRWRRKYSPYKSSKSTQVIRQLDSITHKILSELISKSIEHKLVGKAAFFLTRVEGLCPSGMTFLNDQFVSQFHEKLLKSLKLILIKQSKDVGLFQKDIIIPALSLTFELYIKRKIPTIKLMNIEFSDYVDFIPFIFKDSWDTIENIDPMNHIIYSLFHHVEKDSPKQNDFESVLISMKTEFIKNLCKRLYNPRAVYYLNIIIDYVYAYSVSRYESYLTIIYNYMVELLATKMFLMRISALSIHKYYEIFSLLDKIPKSIIDISKILYNFYDEHCDSNLRMIRVIFALKFSDRVYTNNPTKSPALPEAISILLFKTLHDTSKDMSHFKYSDHNTRIFCLFLNSFRQLLKTKNFEEVLNIISKLLETNEDQKTDEIIHGILHSKYSAAAYLFVDILQKLKCHETLKILAGKIKDIPSLWKLRPLRLSIYSKLFNVLYRKGESINFRNDKDLLDILTDIINDKYIKNFITKNDKYSSLILGYIKKKMITSHESLKCDEEHKLLLLLTSLNPTNDNLKALFRYFFTSKYLSVVLSSERYVLKLINLSTSNDKYMNKQTLISIIRDCLIFLRSTFLKKINEYIDKENQLSFNSNTIKDLSDSIVKILKKPNVQYNDISEYVVPLFQDILRRIKNTIVNNINYASWNSIIEELVDEDEHVTIMSENNGLYESWMFLRKYVEAITLILSHGLKDSLESISYKLPLPVSKILFSFINITLQVALQINDTTSSISDMDISRILHLSTLFISNYSLEVISNTAQFTLFMNGIYKLKIMLFGHSRVSLTKQDMTITEKQQEIWDIQLNKPWKKAYEGVYFLNPILKSYYKLVLSLSSSLLELDIFPHLTVPINFDHLDDPYRILVQYTYLINHNIPSDPKNIKKIWDHLFTNIKSKSNIAEGITSDKLNALTIRALTSLLLRYSYTKLNAKNYRYLNIPLFKLDSLRANIINHKKNSFIDQLVDELIPILKENLIDYINYKTTHLCTAKECLRSVIHLCDIFNTQKFLEFHEILMNYLDNGERYTDDPILSNYLILGISKFVSVTWNVTKTSLQRKQHIVKQLQELFGQFIALCIPLRNRDPEIYFPISKTIILLSLNYIIQSKVFVINSKSNILIYIWIKMFIEPKLSSQVMKYEFNTDVRFLDSSKNPSPLLKYLALDFIQTTDDKTID